MLRVISFGSIGPSPSSAGKTQGLRPVMRFRRLNCSTAGGVSGTTKATPVLVRSGGISQTGTLASRSNSDQRTPVSSDRLTAVSKISWIAIPVRFARLVASSTFARRAASSSSSRARWARPFGASRAKQQLHCRGFDDLSVDAVPEQLRQ
jgi:hypothetical protein